MSLRIRIITAFIAFFVLAGLALAGPVSRTHADDGWCWDDPVVQINGQRLSIDLGVQGQASSVTSASLVITVPEGVHTRLVQSSSAFKTSVVFVHSDGSQTTGRAIPVTVAMQMNTSTPMQTGMRISHYQGSLITSASGPSGTTVASSFTLAR